MVATTALADIADKSGYDQLKDSLKVTAEQSSEKFNSFTMDFSVELKDNGKTLMTANEIKKYDRLKKASENISAGVSLNGYKNNSQSYSDKTTMIRVSDSDPTYYVTEFTTERKETGYENPFKEDSAADIERIADAIVGSLKDHVVATENSDGSLGLAGSLTEVQIPSLINAVASLQLKQEFNGREGNLPHLTKDIFVKEITGTAKVNKEGVMESILGTAKLSGKDEQGTAHEVSIEVLAKLSGINSTTVTKPDLTGKNVVKNIAKSEYSGPEITNPEKYVGKFKNNILIEKDGKFVKVGERILEISKFDNKTIEGRYYEEYKSGFEDYANSKSEFKFDATNSDEKNGSGFDFTTESGSNGNLYIDDYSSKIHFNLNTSSPNGRSFDSTFSPDVE